MKYRILIFSLLLLPSAIFSYNTKSIDSLKVLASQATDTSKVRYVNQIANYFIKINQSDSALTYANLAIDLQKVFNYPQQYASSYSALASVLMDKGDFKSSFAIANKGLELAVKLNDNNLKCLFLLNMSICQKRMGNLELDQKYSLQGLSIAEEVKDSSRIVEFSVNVGALYLDIGNLDKAQLIFRKALGISITRLKANSVSVEYRNLIFSYSNMGILMGQYYQKKIKPIAYLDSAVFYYEKGISIARKINNSKWLMFLLANTSDVYNQKKDYTKALDLLMEGLELASKTENRTSLILIYINIADAYTGLNNTDIAVDYLNKAIELTRQSNMKLFASEAYLSLSKTYEKAKKYDKAFDNYIIYSSYRDSIISQQVTETVSEIAMQYETNQKETELQLLSKDNAIQQHQVWKQKILRNIVGLGLLLIILLAFLMLNRYRYVHRLNIALNNSNLLITKKNILIRDSINYAERIQQLLLPPIEKLRFHFSDLFILNIPKDVIGGDFYWYKAQDHILMFAVVDCTGHGVPGALMSIAANNLLNLSTRYDKLPDVASAVAHVNNDLQNFFVQDQNKSIISDGMDLAICSIDMNNLQLNFSGARSSIYVVRNKKLIEFASERISLGSPVFYNHTFSVQSMQLQKNDKVYLFTDGFADQKGGANSKKFYYEPFKNLITEISSLSGTEQKEELRKAFQEWKGEKEQTDDILIVGLVV